MNLLSRLFRREAPQEVDDPVFGKLVRKTGQDWEGEAELHHPRTRLSRVTVFVDAGAGPPNAAQQALFLEIRRRYDQLWPTIAQALANYHDEIHNVRQIEALVEVTYLQVEPTAEGAPRKWSIDYTLNDDREGGMGYTVEFVEFELTGISGSD